VEHCGSNHGAKIMGQNTGVMQRKDSILLAQQPQQVFQHVNRKAYQALADSYNGALLPAKTTRIIRKARLKTFSEI